MATIAAHQSVPSTGGARPRSRTGRESLRESRHVAKSAAQLSRPERAALVALAIVLALCALASRHPTVDAMPTSRVRVQPGDTVWTIAKEHALPGLSTAQTADLITRLNGLDTARLVSGTEIDVPTSPGTPYATLASR